MSFQSSVAEANGYLWFSYYDLATDFYEEAWGQQFHFCRFAIGESMLKALARHEHYLAYMMGLKAGMKVLDVGCGVGGPAREISNFTGCDIIGLNNNGYQIQKATAHAKRENLDHKISFAKGDFMVSGLFDSFNNGGPMLTRLGERQQHLEFPDNTFDAAYAIEATVHAPSLQAVYEQIFRVLKPGGTFAVYEWVMTDKYDETNAKHREMRLGIERGNGIANMMPRWHAVKAIQAAGFKLEHQEDLAARGDEIPWFAPLDGDLRFVTTPWEYLPALRMTRFGRAGASSLLRVLEKLRLMPSGTADTTDELARGAENLVAGGKEGLFTPMYLMVARKPAE